MQVFPTRHFFFAGHSAEIEARTVSGGTSIAGDEDLIRADGGGRVVVEFSDPDLGPPAHAQAWRALSALFDGGATSIIVPLGDARNNGMGDVRLPPGGLPWWDESDFAGVATGATVLGDVPLRATSMTVRASFLPGAIRPGQWFSIDHPVRRYRSYLIAEILVDAGENVTISFRPPLRETVTNGAAVDFLDPKCTMRLDGEMKSPTTLGYAESEGVRFVEQMGAIA